MTSDSLIATWRTELKWLGRLLDDATDEDTLQDFRSMVLNLRGRVRQACTEANLWWDEGESIDNMIRKLESYERAD